MILPRERPDWSSPQGVSCHHIIQTCKHSGSCNVCLLKRPDSCTLSTALYFYCTLHTAHCTLEMQCVPNKLPAEVLVTRGSTGSWPQACRASKPMCPHSLRGNNMWGKLQIFLEYDFFYLIFFLQAICGISLSGFPFLYFLVILLSIFLHNFSGIFQC